MMVVLEVGCWYKKNMKFHINFFVKNGLKLSATLSREKCFLIFKEKKKCSFVLLYFNLFSSYLSYYLQTNKKKKKNVEPPLRLSYSR